MEQLAKLLQQAQVAVLSAQEDVATMRAQLDESGDEAIVNPSVIDLQLAIQQKQEAAVELLKRGAGFFYERMGELDERARALGNIETRERELEKTKKAMQRYFDAQRKTQDELKDEYDGLLSVQEQKLVHVTDSAAGLIRCHAARRMQNRALTLWLKKAMIRSFWRLHQQQETERTSQLASFTQDQNDRARESHTVMMEQVLRRKLFHAWERRVHKRANRRLQAEVAQLEKEADFFRTECAKTQRVLSGHLQDDHTRMQLTMNAKSRECELLDDEVGRLKLALTELTGEFSERTQTYVRQQAETELFFQRKEQKLRDALVEVQTELEKLRAHTKRFHADMHTLEAATTIYTANTSNLFWESITQKEVLLAESSRLLFGRLAQRHKRSMEEVAELRENVDLLSPLSEKVLRTTNELATVKQSAESHKKAAQLCSKQVDQLGLVASLLTDHLERANHHKLRSFYLMCWATHATAKRTRALAAEKGELQATLRTKQREFLIQQQGVAAKSREERDRLLAEIEDQRITVKSLQKEVAELMDQGERKEGQNYEAQMDINKLKAQLSRSEQEKQSLRAKLSTAKVENLNLEEDTRRYSLERKEAVWRSGLQQQHVEAWRTQAETLVEGTAHLTQVCEQWSQHCDTTTAVHRQAVREQRERSARALLQANQCGRLGAVFLQWQVWSRRAQALREAHAKHALKSRLASEALEAERRRHQRDTKERLADAQARHEMELAMLKDTHAREAADQERHHDRATNDLRAEHSVALSTAAAAHALEYQTQAEELAAVHARALRDLRDAHAQQLVALSAKEDRREKVHTDELVGLREKHKAEAAALTAKHALEISRWELQHEEELRQLRSKHANHVSVMATEHAQHVKGLQEVFTTTQAKLGEVADLVVFYCAQAAFAKWQAHARARCTARETVQAEAQIRQYRQAAQEWMTTRAELITQRYQVGDELLLAAVASRQELVAAGRTGEYKELYDRHQKLSALFEEVTTTGEAMEQELHDLSTEARRLRVQRDAEKGYADAMRAKLAHFTVQRDVQLLLYDRAIRHHQRADSIVEAHHRRAQRCFEESYEAVCDAFLARPLARHAEAARTSAPIPDVSPINSERGSVESTSNLPTPRTRAELKAGTVSEVETLDSLAVPEGIKCRLMALEGASNSYEQSQHKDVSSLESIKHTLAEPFTACTGETDARLPLSSLNQASLKALTRLPARRAPEALSSVEAALEVVRRSALCLVAADERRLKEDANASAEKLRSVEETLQDVRHSMETLLSEQRRLASEMKSDANCSRSLPSASASVSPSHDVSRGIKTTPQLYRSAINGPNGGTHAEAQTPAFLMDAWTERLDMLASRYQRVLNAFANNVEQRQSTFYSVNGMLVATEMFSAELLSRFEANMEEMKAIKATLNPEPAPKESETRSQGTSPVDTAAFMREQEQQVTLVQLQDKLADAAGAYETVLQQFLASVREGYSTFQLSSRVLQAAGSFSERLVDKFKQSLAELSSAREVAALEPLLAAAPIVDDDARPRRSLACDFQLVTEGGEESREPELGDLKSPSPATTTSSATRASSGAHAPPHIKEDSPEKIILRDRVELLERLLVQSKLQLAETRQLLATSGNVAGLPPLRDAEAFDGSQDTGAPHDTVQQLQAKQGEMQKAHEEQLVRVRADTEQLVMLRYKEEAQKREGRTRDLLDKMDENNRLFECEKAALLRKLDEAKAQLRDLQAEHERALEQVQRRFDRSLDELGEENATLEEQLQEALNATEEAVSQALQHQQERLAAEMEAEVGRLRAEVRRLSSEREHLQQRKDASEKELRRIAAEAQAALAEAVRRHNNEIDQQSDRYERALEAAAESQQKQIDTPVSLVTALAVHTQTHMELLHHHCDTAVEMKMAYVLEVLVDKFMVKEADASPPAKPSEEMLPIAELLGSDAAYTTEALEEKCDYLVASSLACQEVYYTHLLTQAVRAIECEKEELETEIMQLREQMAHIKADSEERSTSRGDQDVNDLTGGCKTAASPSMPQSQSYRGGSSGERPDAGTPLVVKGVPTGGTLLGSSSCTSSQMDEGSLQTSSPPVVEPAHPNGDTTTRVTPTRTTRDRSLDSLELSQQMLRYSRMLNEQEERNSERLHHADALSAQVDDLIARGERLRAFAEREHLTPRRRH